VGLKVTIDLHGAPGSQNGQDNSGLIGPVLFASNSSNIDRSLNVLHNLTQEFSKDIYGGVVVCEFISLRMVLFKTEGRVAIELLNEPRISDAMFPMDNLREFYGNATQLVQGNSSSSVNVTYHGDFFPPYQGH
jgi:glucan 1,3-beta-glucosidase